MSFIFSGVQPTGTLHLGNYLGAIKNWVNLQHHGIAGLDTPGCLFCIVDLHAITVPQVPEDLREATLKTAATYIACGIEVDPRQQAGRTGIYTQSAVPEHAELAWILNCHTPLGWLNRMTQFKEKAGKHRDNAVLGLYAYPVLMAADILLHGTTHVPVGEDQKQHLELARDIAGAFNRHYNREVFTIPEPLILGTATRVMSLRDGSKKMSKSDESDYSRINLTDSADTIRLKIQKAKTDPDPLPDSVAGLEGRPEARNLLTIMAALEERPRPFEAVVAQYAGMTFSAFKTQLTEQLVATLAPIALRIEHLMTFERDALEGYLKEGTVFARERAAHTMDTVRKTVGFFQPEEPVPERTLRGGD
jgi:tryptophanyl-tRNA synthetase